MSNNENNHPASSKLYRAEQVRELDRMSIQEFGIPGYVLMTRAGDYAFQLIREHYPHARSVSIFCGSGNNAGDGYIVARLALQAGLNVQVVSVSSAKKLLGDARSAFLDYEKAGGNSTDYDPATGIKAEIVVDALLGTGLDRPVSGVYAEAINTINNHKAAVIALDIPSGLNADTGVVMGCAVMADMTVTFIGLKQGLYTGQAADCCGEIYFSSLDAPEEIYQKLPSSALLMTKPVLAQRARTAHKGQNGHVLVIGGEKGFTGAVRLAAEASARVGAGLVSIATRPEHAGLLNLERPELMCHGIETSSQLRVLAAKASVLAVGPGLGQTHWAAELFEQALYGKKPIVVDADALNLLAKEHLAHENWILTPHPGEAARLLNCSTAEINADRFAAVKALQEKYQGVCVLKGAGSLITDGSEIHLSNTGNPGMASGGMGDVLTGVIAGLIAQGMDNAEAARTGVYWHGLAADYAAEQGERGLLASDLMAYLRKLVNTST